MSLERFLQTDCYGWQGPMVQYLVASSCKRNKVNLLFECLVTWSKTWELENKTFSFNKFGDLQRRPLYKAPKSSNRGTQQMFPLQSSAAREPLTPLLQISLHWLLLELLVPNHYQSPDRCTLWKCCQKNTGQIPRQESTRTEILWNENMRKNYCNIQLYMVPSILLHSSSASSSSASSAGPSSFSTAAPWHTGFHSSSSSSSSSRSSCPSCSLGNSQFATMTQARRNVKVEQPDQLL